MKKLYYKWFETTVTRMIAVADENELVLLEFEDRKNLGSALNRLEAEYKLEEGTTFPLESIIDEVTEYFNGRLETFKTPFRMTGTPFQKEVWKKLRDIPYADTWSYGKLATVLGQKNAFRAVANANGANQLAIIVPCHRVINTDGKLGGYGGGGVKRKKWLLSHEEANAE